MACVAPESADPRRGLSEISNLDGFSSAANDRFRRILPVPARSGGGRLTERTAAVQSRRRQRVKVPHCRPSVRIGRSIRAAVTGHSIESWASLREVRQALERRLRQVLKIDQLPRNSGASPGLFEIAPLKTRARAARRSIPHRKMFIASKSARLPTLIESSVMLRRVSNNGSRPVSDGVRIARRSG